MEIPDDDVATLRESFSAVEDSTHGMIKWVNPGRASKAPPSRPRSTPSGRFSTTAALAFQTTRHVQEARRGVRDEWQRRAGSGAGSGSTRRSEKGCSCGRSARADCSELGVELRALAEKARDRRGPGGSERDPVPGLGVLTLTWKRKILSEGSTGLSVSRIAGMPLLFC